MIVPSCVCRTPWRRGRRTRLQRVPVPMRPPRMSRWPARWRSGKALQIDTSSLLVTRRRHWRLCHPNLGHPRSSDTPNSDPDAASAGIRRRSAIGARSLREHPIRQEFVTRAVPGDHARQESPGRRAATTIDSRRWTPSRSSSPAGTTRSSSLCASTLARQTRAADEVIVVDSTRRMPRRVGPPPVPTWSRIDARHLAGDARGSTRRPAACSPASMPIPCPRPTGSSRSSGGCRTPITRRS